MSVPEHADNSRGGCCSTQAGQAPKSCGLRPRPRFRNSGSPAESLIPRSGPRETLHPVISITASAVRRGAVSEGLSIAAHALVMPRMRPPSAHGYVFAAARAGRDLREIPSRIASPSTNGPRMSTPESRAAIGRVTSSFASAHGQCSFSMNANRA